MVFIQLDKQYKLNMSYQRLLEALDTIIVLSFRLSLKELFWINTSVPAYHALV